MARDGARLKTLNVVGCGRVGRTLAKLLSEAAAFELQDVLTSSPQSAARAVAFIGSGRAADAIAAMRSAEVWMLTPPDGQILECSEALTRSGLLRAGDVVFHCSGALASAVLEPAARCGASLASVHPLKSFAAPAAALEDFRGAFCAVEGDAAAVALLQPAFERIRATLFNIAAARETRY